MRTLMLFFFALVALAFSPGSAPALERGACHEDIEKYCKNVPVAQLKECMKQHIHELSDACKANMVDLYLEKKHKSGN